MGIARWEEFLLFSAAYLRISYTGGYVQQGEEETEAVRRIIKQKALLATTSAAAPIDPALEKHYDNLINVIVSQPPTWMATNQVCKERGKKIKKRK